MSKNKPIRSGPKPWHEMSEEDWKALMEKEKEKVESQKED